MKKPAHILFFLLAIPFCSLSHPGIGIVSDSKGNIFYTDLAQVFKIDKAGKKTIVVPHVHTHELYIDAQDNLFGEHLWYNGEQKNTWGYYVWKLSPDGRVEKVIPDQEGFRVDYSFVRDRSGRSFWADRSQPCQKVIRKDNGSSTAISGDACFQNIRWITGAKDGAYVVDFQDVKKVDSHGLVKTLATRVMDKKVDTSTIKNQNSVFGVWDDPAGNIYVAVGSNREVKKFSPLGKEEIVFKTSFPWSPSGGLIDASGNLWVLEYNILNAVRVEKVTADRKTTRF